MKRGDNKKIDYKKVLDGYFPFGNFLFEDVEYHYSKIKLFGGIKVDPQDLVEIIVNQYSWLKQDFL